MPFLYPKIIDYAREEDTPGAHRCQLKPESLDKSRFYLSPDPPKSPLRRGTLRRLLSPPWEGGVGGKNAGGSSSNRQTTVSEWV